MIDLTCIGCGATVQLDIPEGDGIGAKFARAIARKAPRCDRCLAIHEQAEADNAAASELTARRSACLLPRKWRGLSLADFEPLDGQRNALEAAREWAGAADAGGLMLIGEVGTGKTRLASAACWTRLEHWPCGYASVAQAMVQLGENFSEEGRRRAVRVFAGTGPIVLDDFDKTRVTDFGREQLFAAVDSRYQAEAPLLVTTNLTPKEIGNRYGQAIMSRLVEYCRKVEVAGGDRRLQRPEVRAA